MAITVVCHGCHKRFEVSDKFAGRTGPCPGCKTEIKIPSADDAVVVHAPEESGPKGVGGQPVLKPITRRENKLPVLVWVAIGCGVAVVLTVAVIVRFQMENPPMVLAVIAAIALAPPLSIAGYAFLRDDELDAYRGRALWGRAAICGAVYAFLWAIFAWGPGLMAIDELPIFGIGILFALMLAIGGVAPLACFDLDYLMGAVHSGFYLLVTGALYYLAGGALFGYYLTN